MPQADQRLYVHEQYKFGSADKELAEFRRHMTRVIEAQKAIAQEHAPGRPQRVFHAKTHACLAGRLTLLDSRPDATRQGIFGPGGKDAYNLLARFSGGVGFDQHDLKPDVRGLALKIFAADGRGPRTVDFLMTNAPNPFGRDQEEFVRFMEASVDPGFLGARLSGFLIGHTEVARLLLKATLRVIPSLATEQYWSGHPYLLGPRQAMKFNVRPLPDGPAAIDDEVRQETARLQARIDRLGDRLDQQITQWLEMRSATGSRLNPNYLSNELRDRLRRGPLRFVFSVQLENDPQTTPIENTLVEWMESDSPSIPVAELTLDRAIDPAAAAALRFTPGHFHPDHRPLGNMGRGRLFTYEASQEGRSAPADEPREDVFFGA